MKIDIYSHAEGYTAIYIDGKKVMAEDSISFEDFLYHMGITHSSYSFEIPLEDEDDEDAYETPDTVARLQEIREKHPNWVTKHHTQGRSLYFGKD